MLSFTPVDGQKDVILHAIYTYTMYLKLILLSVILIGIALAGFAVKMFFIKGAEFKKSCSSTTPNGERLGCVCGGGEGSCERRKEGVEVHAHPHH
ncbi:MAG: hypothetical protein H3C41_06160 [Bacteroidales bacterium]|mgnify:CR=1 FL=1|nr:hypothetical protein [Bacteroidales bacterium]